MAWKTLKKTLGSTSAEALVSSSTKCKTAIIQAKRGNSAAVYIGDSNVAADRGIELIAPQTNVQMELLELKGAYGNDIDLSVIYAKGSSNDGICVLYDEF